MVHSGQGNERKPGDRHHNHVSEGLQGEIQMISTLHSRLPFPGHTEVVLFRLPVYQSDRVVRDGLPSGESGSPAPWHARRQTRLLTSHGFEYDHRLVHAIKGLIGWGHLRLS